MTGRWLVVLVVFLALGGSLWAQSAQQPTQVNGESHRWRIVGTAAGAGGGFALGMFIGLRAYNEAVFSESKVMAVAAASAAAGAVGGYFIGRKIDKSRAETVWRMDETDRSLLRAQLCLPPPHVMFMAAN